MSNTLRLRKFRFTLLFSRVRDSAKAGQRTCSAAARHASSEHALPQNSNPVCVRSRPPLGVSTKCRIWRSNITNQSGFPLWYQKQTSTTGARAVSWSPRRAHCRHTATVMGCRPYFQGRHALLFRSPGCSVCHARRFAHACAAAAAHGNVIGRLPLSTCKCSLTHAMSSCC